MSKEKKDQFEAESWRQIRRRAGRDRETQAGLESLKPGVNVQRVNSITQILSCELSRIFAADLMPFASLSIFVFI